MHRVRMARSARLLPTLGVLLGTLCHLTEVARAADPAPDAQTANTEPTPDVAPARGTPTEVTVPARGDGMPADEVEVVVTGSRTERPLTEAPVATEVISRTQIDRSGADTVAELLERHQGLVVQRAATGFSDAGVQLSGLDAKYVLILIDGQRIGGRVGGTIDLNRLQLEHVERIEIVRGAASALYGSDALGGVVNIITKRTRKPLQIDTKLEAGSYESVKLDLGVGTRQERWDAALTTSLHTRDSYDWDTTDAATSGTAYDQLTLGLRGGLILSKEVRLSSHAEYLLRDQRGVANNAAGATFDHTNRTESFSVDLSPRLNLGGGNQLRLSTAFFSFRDQFLQDQRGASALDQLQVTHEQLGTVRGQLDSPITDDHFLSVGVEGMVELLRSQRLEGAAGMRTRLSAYVQDEWTVSYAPLFVIVPGARVDADSQFGTEPTPRIALRYDPSDEIVLRAGYGMGFRAPDFRELLLFFENPSVGYVIEGNPELEPERSHSFNLGAEWRPEAKWWGSVNLFHNELDNVIVTLPTSDSAPGGEQRFQYVNVASAFTQGADLSAKLSVLTSLEIDAHYTLMRTHDREQNRPLPGRATHRGGAGVHYSADDAFSATLRAVITGPREFHQDARGVQFEETRKTDAYTTLDAQVTRAMGAHVTLFIDGSNLLNAGDAEFLPIAPRSFFVGLRGRY